MRLSTMLALPTDEDIHEMGAANAGEYLITLQSASPTEYQNFIKRKRQRWDREPRQRVWRCVDHVCHYLVRIVEVDVHLGGKSHASDIDARVSEKEAAHFFMRRQDRQKLESQAAIDATDFADGLARVRERVRDAMNRVKLFAGLSGT